MLRLFFLSVFLSCALSGGAMANKPPLPPKKTTSLESLKSELAARQEEKKRLAGQVEGAEKELKTTRKDLKETAALARENEQKLVTLEQRIAILSAEKQDLTTKLQSDYGSMADLIMALERLRRVPPEALIVRPGAPLQTAQTALLLQSILPAIDKRADELSAALKRLQTVSASLDADRAEVLKTKEALDKKYREIEALASTREKLYRDLNGDYRETAAAVERIGKQAQSMQELMARLAREQEAQRTAESVSRKSGVSRVSRTEKDMPRPGHPRLPVAGVIMTGFGQKDLIGAVSEGITIEAQQGGLVLTPIGGIVRYAGSFKNYGKMIILQHKDGYHSLIAGLDRIDAAVGQSLEAGEPLGKLPSFSSRGGKPALYYELRHKGRPVNPSEKFADLRS